jgi:pilus assembly protein Flp/PilA
VSGNIGVSSKDKSGCGEKGTTMNKVKNILMSLAIVKDTKGQDLIEYALMAGFVAVAAGAIMPDVASNISTIFSKVSSSMGSAATQGS